MTQPGGEHIIIRQFKQGDHHAFRVLYEKHAPKLLAFSKNYLQSNEDAEEIVQEVFLRIWEKRQNIDEHQSFSSYVIQAAKHRIYNSFRKKVNAQLYLDFLLFTDNASKNFTEIDVEFNDIKIKAEAAISAMPPKRQEIFRMSRELGLKNKEIADKLDISIKTVENQMSQALKFLKDALNEYQLPIILLLISHALV